MTQRMVNTVLVTFVLAIGVVFLVAFVPEQVFQFVEIVASIVRFLIGLVYGLFAFLYLLAGEVSKSIPAAEIEELIRVYDGTFAESIFPLTIEGVRNAMQFGISLSLFGILSGITTLPMCLLFTRR